MKKVREQAGQFFDLSTETKESVGLSGNKHFRGYTAMDEEIKKGVVPDHKEAMDFAVQVEKVEDPKLTW
jgi:isopenicillin N synthase-like dioxygenase